jgi:IS5 family transposase
MTRLPDESTILRFRHMLEEHQLGQQILAAVNAKLIGNRPLEPKV